MLTEKHYLKTSDSIYIGPFTLIQQVGQPYTIDF